MHLDRGETLGGAAGPALVNAEDIPDMPPCSALLRSLLAVAAGLGCAVPAALAAEPAAITLYEHAGWAGRTFDFSGAASPGVGRFNDRASSVEVRRGRWQLCTDADFGGQCMVLGPGRHGLSGRFHDGISSVRRVVGANDEPLTPGAALVLYEHAGLQGRAVLIRGATPGLEGFNDKASSIEVLEGQWQVCTDADYRGDCQIQAPGARNLQGAFHDRLSSVRPAPEAAVASPAPATAPPAQTGGGQAPALVLYESPMGQGRALPANAAIADLAAVQFNDMASSVAISSGNWQLCTDANYRGSCTALGPGRHNIGKAMNDRVSSLRPVDAAPAQAAPNAPTAPAAQVGLTLYDGADFNGRALQMSKPTAFSPELNNGRPASVVVHSGRWELCEQPGFNGRCVTLPAGQHRLSGALERVASVRPR